MGLDRMGEIEKMYDTEEEEKLTELIKVRKSLWT